MGRYDEAIARWRKLRELDSDFVKFLEEGGFELPQTQDGDPSTDVTAETIRSYHERIASLDRLIEAYGARNAEETAAGEKRSADSVA